MTRQSPHRGRAGAEGGMTLMELMVSLAILAIMILMANSLLVRSRRTVRLAQDTIKANANVRAATDRLRADLASATNEGFLAIVYYPDDTPHLIFTTVSTYRSVLDPLSANACTIDIGLTNDADQVLWRRARLHDATTPGMANDHVNWALVGYRMNLLQPRTVIQNILSPAAPIPMELTKPPTMTLPVMNLQDAAGIWPYMIADVQELKIQWTDGTKNADGRLVWYDRDNPKRGDWPTRDANSQDASLNENAPEYNFSGANVNPQVYCALWTFRKKDNWPKAIRFELSLGDPARLYEVVVRLPN